MLQILQKEIIKHVYHNLWAAFPEKYNDIVLLNTEANAIMPSVTIARGYTVMLNYGDISTKMELYHSIITSFTSDCAVYVHKYNSLTQKSKRLKRFDIAEPTFTEKALASYVLKAVRRDTKEFTGDEVKKHLNDFKAAYKLKRLL